MLVQLDDRVDSVCRDEPLLDEQRLEGARPELYLGLGSRMMIAVVVVVVVVAVIVVVVVLAHAGSR